MKLKIRVGGLLCLFLRCAVCSYATGNQNYIGFNVPVLHQLAIRDSVPDIGVIPVLNYKHSSVRLSDFKDRLLVLDFWATTCGSCLEAMPSIAALQHRYKGRLQVIDVDYERADYVAAYLNRHPEKRSLGLPVIGSDVLLKKMFPYQYLPHIVWIRNGVFIGATDGDYLDSANIERVLTDKSFTFSDHPGLPAVVYDFHSPLYQVVSQVNGKNADSSLSPISSYVLSAALPNVPLQAGWDTTGGRLRFYAINHPLLNLYALALNSGLPFVSNRRILDLHDSSMVLNIDHLYEDQYLSLHSYCTEIVMSGKGASKEQAMRLLGYQVGASLGLNGSIRKMERDCLSLSIKSDSVHSAYPVKAILYDLAKSGPVSLHHINLDDLAWFMNEREGVPPVFVGSGNGVHFDLDFATLPKTVAQWKAALAAQGIVLKSEKRMLDMFVLSDHPD